MLDAHVRPTQSRLGHCLLHPVSLLFTSYLAVMGVVMLVTGVVASRIGPKPTLPLGLLVNIAGAGLAGISDRVPGIVGWRALWGSGNTLFVATALAR